jgi:hypothetical protein
VSAVSANHKRFTSVYLSKIQLSERVPADGPYVPHADNARTPIHRHVPVQRPEPSLTLPEKL